jgi:hypothetical protein
MPRISAEPGLGRLIVSCQRDFDSVIAMDKVNII